QRIRARLLADDCVHNYYSDLNGRILGAFSSPLSRAENLARRRHCHKSHSVPGEPQFSVFSRTAIDAVRSAFCTGRAAGYRTRGFCRWLPQRPVLTVCLNETCAPSDRNRLVDHRRPFCRLSDSLPCSWCMHLCSARSDFEFHLRVSIPPGDGTSHPWNEVLQSGELWRLDSADGVSASGRPKSQILLHLLSRHFRELVGSKHYSSFRLWSPVDRNHFSPTCLGSYEQFYRCLRNSHGGVYFLRLRSAR